MKKTPKVSVCIVTYNHENLIAECLESIVTQECDFDFEVIVGEDCSTDGTRKIVEEYVEKYPDIIKPIYHDVNVGVGKNYFSTHNVAQGKYIAHLDGDDYALPGKLQAQAEFMDKTHDCNICFHRIKVLYPNGDILDDLINYEHIKDGFSKKEILMYVAIAAHSSKMYRAELRDFIKPNFMILDFFINVEQIKDKKAYFIDNNIYGVYRIGVGISTNSKEHINNNIIYTFDYFINKYPEYLNEISSNYLITFLVNFKNGNDYKSFLWGWLRVFSIKGIYLAIKTWKTRRMFRAEKQG